jgi:hypothetical protein
MGRSGRVIAGLDPAIHAAPTLFVRIVYCRSESAWMRGSGPRMTMNIQAALLRGSSGGETDSAHSRASGKTPQ